MIEKTSPGGQKSTRAATLLTIIQRDVCTDTVLFNATGSAANQTFQVAGNLSSAILSAVVRIVDKRAGPETFVVNLTWTATGSAEFLHFKETFVDPELGIKDYLTIPRLGCASNRSWHGVRPGDEPDAQHLRFRLDSEPERRDALDPEGVLAAWLEQALEVEHGESEAQAKGGTSAAQAKNRFVRFVTPLLFPSIAPLGPPSRLCYP